ncbi:carboxylate--amine ligase [Lapidilactobacillus bayanensis]|uniref:carboxylate--amine ligase n=1 Tax=Lapidilactobacillus bayanensis TaxID=2485998 RepID=UPI000F770164|nr:carboxylate--amine ligase [Lapidilactobacillus bayanensis]
MQELNFIPIIVGTDLNTYNVAISFHEKYGIHPILVGSAPLSFTEYSTIPGQIEYYPKLHQPEEFPKILAEVAQKYAQPDKKLLLVGTSDMYVRYIVENADFLRQYYVFNYPNLELLNQLQYKKNFYQLCAEMGVDYPKTYFYDCAQNAQPFHEEMMYPVVVKPSNVVKYYDMHFAGKKKIYRLNSEEEVNQVLTLLHQAHYDDEAIVQEYIPGDDTYMFDGVLYANTQGKVELVAMGQVVLQEHTPTAIGNYTAIISRYNLPLMQKMQSLLEKIHYTGFANFDIKYDKRDHKFKLFEINIRQGRSSYYITQTGHNMAEYLVDDCVNHLAKETVYNDQTFLFTIVPKTVLRQFVQNPKINQECRQLIKDKKWGNPLFYHADKSLKRKLFLAARQANYVRKYRNNKW